MGGTRGNLLRNKHVGPFGTWNTSIKIASVSLPAGCAEVARQSAELLPYLMMCDQTRLRATTCSIGLILIERTFENLNLLKNYCSGFEIRQKTSYLTHARLVPSVAAQVVVPVLQ